MEARRTNWDNSSADGVEEEVATPYALFSHFARVFHIMISLTPIQLRNALSKSLFPALPYEGSRFK